MYGRRSSCDLFISYFSAPGMEPTTFKYKNDECDKD